MYFRQEITPSFLDKSYQVVVSMRHMDEERDWPDTPASESRIQTGRDFAPPSPTASHGGSSKECAICHRELSFFTRKRKCTLCNAVTCKDCASKKTIPGEVACRNCLDQRNLKRETTGDSGKSPTESPKSNGDDPLAGEGSAFLQKIPKGYFGYIRVRLIEGRGLVAADTNLLGQKTSSDPYCIVSLSRDRTRQSTRVIQSTLNPVWNETLEMPVRLPVQMLEIDVYDKDVAGSDDFIGKVYIPVERLPNGKPMTGWVPIVYTKENDDPGTELSFGDPGTAPAGAVLISVRLDYKIRSELRGYIRASVSEAPPKKIKFDINALYGPGMLVLELLWTRMLSPFVTVFLYVLMWENFIVSLVATAMWLPIATHIEYWPSAFFFWLDFVIFYNYIYRSFKALSNPMEAAPVSNKKMVARLAKMPFSAGHKVAQKAMGLAMTGSKAITDLSGATGSESKGKPSPAVKPVVPGGEKEAPPDYEEQSLGSVVNKLLFVSPGWLKEMLAGLQPVARSAADGIAMVYDIFHGAHDQSLLVFFICLVIGVILLYVPFRYFVATLGVLVMFATSPLMKLIMGAVSYLTRPKRFNDPALFGLWKGFSAEWMSADSVMIAKRKKTNRGLTSMHLL